MHKLNTVVNNYYNLIHLVKVLFIFTTTVSRFQKKEEHRSSLLLDMGTEVLLNHL